MWLVATLLDSAGLGGRTNRLWLLVAGRRAEVGGEGEGGADHNLKVSLFSGGPGGNASVQGMEWGKYVHNSYVPVSELSSAWPSTRTNDVIPVGWF